MKKLMYIMAIMATVAFVSCNKGGDAKDAEKNDSTKVEQKDGDKKCCANDDKKCCKAEKISRAEEYTRAFEAACEANDQEALMRLSEEAYDITPNEFTMEQAQRIQDASVKYAKAHAEEFGLNEEDFEGYDF